MKCADVFVSPIPFALDASISQPSITNGSTAVPEPEVTPFAGVKPASPLIRIGAWESKSAGRADARLVNRGNVANVASNTTNSKAVDRMKFGDRFIRSQFNALLIKFLHI